MIQLKKCNYFTGESFDVSNVITSIVNFLEIDGTNSLLFTPPKSKNTTGLIYNLNPQIIWNSYDDFKEKIEDKSNLFRINLLIFDFWSLNRALIPKYKQIIDKLDINYIITAKEYTYKNSDDITDFHIKKESNTSSLSYKQEIFITNKIDGWTATLDSLKTGYIRDKKINNILKK
jgi:hypothetical protein